MGGSGLHIYRLVIIRVFCRRILQHEKQFCHLMPSLVFPNPFHADIIGIIGRFIIRVSLSLEI